jgi:putative zinc finger/helix-turn-helix YgiT family protein
MEDGTMKCPNCRQQMETRRENHRYSECGLDNVFLDSIEIHSCQCGERIVSIPKLAQLHEVIAFAVAKQAARLTGQQVRFLRKYLGWSGVQFAEVIGVDQTTVSRWETGAMPMGSGAERFLRLAVFRMRPLQDYPTENLAAVAKDEAPRETIRIASTGRGWNELHAA